MKKALIAGAAVTAMALVAALAYAQVAAGGSAAPRLLPYVGHLDHDGTPVTGQVAMKVCLTPAADTSCSAATWSEQFDSVEVAGGAFSLVLGQQTAIPDGIWKSGSPVYIRAMVGATVAEGAPTFVQLSGAQRVLSVPYAVNVDGASSLRVDGPIVRGTGTVGKSDMGLYSQAEGQWMRLVTNGGDIRFNTDGNAGTGFWGTDATSKMAITKDGVKIGNSPTIKQITTCRMSGNFNWVGYKRAPLFANDTNTTCSNGAPTGTCMAFLGKTFECGQSHNWGALNPGDKGDQGDKGNASYGPLTYGGIEWYGESCGPWNTTATWICG